MIVYEISHTLDSQAEYVAADSPAEAIEKLKKEYVTENCPSGRLSNADISSVTKLGDLII